ncbi:MAG: hypothetical protein C4518_09925 [Desulfobacteraceae bacterium]|nr:MAG: hypothetical protein C4518_09925 [Desulfobacteraceae bacterium]
MNNKLSLFFIKKCLTVALLFLFLTPAVSMAYMEEDIEKPKPEFTVEDGITTAKLIPRAKSTSVTLAFEVTGGGTLAAVNAFDINKAMSPQINNKDFRSDLFLLEIGGVAPGGEATLTITSAFFTSSTYFWIFNEQLPTPWMDSQAENIPLGDKVQQFVVRIKDGGQFDSDGAANGRITLIGGPMDSFWGYVLGTLFIRFFGVFIVLSVLMAGMMLSGAIFQRIERKPKEIQPVIPPVNTPAQAAAPTLPASPASDEIPPEMAAAIGMALSMHLSPRQMAASARDMKTETEPVPPVSLWAVDGRRQLMTDRSMVFNRIKG